MRPPIMPPGMLPRPSGRMAMKMAPRGMRTGQIRSVGRSVSNRGRGVSSKRGFKVGMAGAAMGGMVLAMSRNTGPGVTTTRGRPTGVYKY